LAQARKLASVPADVDWWTADKKPAVRNQQS
jgi:hypothetical protein